MPYVHELNVLFEYVRNRQARCGTGVRFSRRSATGTDLEGEAIKGDDPQNVFKVRVPRGGCNPIHLLL